MRAILVPAHRQVNARRARVVTKVDLVASFPIVRHNQAFPINSLKLESNGIRSATMRNRIDWASLFFLLFWSYVVWTWAKWLASGHSVESRSKEIVAVAGLYCATVSTGFAAFLYIHAVVTGGYPYQNPVEAFCIVFGALMAILGIICALAGAGKLRLHVAIISIANLLLWFADLMSQ